MFKKLYQLLMQFILAKPDGPEALDMRMEALMEDAQSGRAEAQYQIGKNYLYGLYFNQDIPAALRWLELAAKQYHVQAESLLAQYYYPRLSQYPNYQEQVIEWAEHAALRHDTEACAIWGEILLTGLGNQAASISCMRFLQEAAAQQHTRAQYLIGTLYLYGKWMDKDTQQAKHWIELSAKQGYTPAQTLLGEMYQEGFGVEKNYTEAEYWFAQAKQQKVEE